MSVRARGLWLFMGCTVAAAAAFWLVFPLLSDDWKKAFAYSFALPVVGAVIGLLELATGSPIQKIDEGWQRVPGYVRIPTALIGSVAVLWVLIKILGF